MLRWSAATTKQRDHSFEVRSSNKSQQQRVCACVTCIGDVGVSVPTGLGGGQPRSHQLPGCRGRAEVTNWGTERRHTAHRCLLRSKSGIHTICLSQSARGTLTTAARAADPDRRVTCHIRRVTRVCGAARAACDARRARGHGAVTGQGQRRRH